ncbi:MAG: hypothetical protein AB1815_05925 [Bacillota bacterium]
MRKTRVNTPQIVIEAAEARGCFQKDALQLQKITFDIILHNI